MTSLSSLLWLYTGCAIVLPSVVSEQIHWSFNWGFDPEPPEFSFSYCSPWKARVYPHKNVSNPLAPYYMISYPLNGTPQTTLIGSDGDNLTYTVTQPVDTMMALQIVDSNGIPGGVPPNIYRVVKGQPGIQCATDTLLPIPKQQVFTATANVTRDDLNNCQPWKVSISGGSPPYSISFVQTDLPTTTNVTLPVDDNTYIYVNTTTHNSTLIAAVSDKTGRWASNPPHVHTLQTAGGLSCIDRSSSMFVQAHNPTNWKRTMAIALGSSFVACLGIVIFAWWYRQKRKLRQDRSNKTPILDDHIYHPAHPEFPRYSNELTMYPPSASPLGSHIQELSTSYITTPLDISGPSTWSMRTSSLSPLNDRTDPSILRYSKASMQSPSMSGQNLNTENTEAYEGHQEALPSRNAYPDDFPPPYVASNGDISSK